MPTLADAIMNPVVGDELKETYRKARELQDRMYEELFNIPSIGSTFEHEEDGETYRLIEMKTDPVRNELTGYGICVKVSQEEDSETAVVMDPKVVYFPQVKAFAEQDPTTVMAQVIELMSDFDLDIRDLLASDVTDMM